MEGYVSADGSETKALVVFWVGVKLVEKGAVETRDGPTVVGGLKNEPSSRVSKKSLRTLGNGEYKEEIWWTYVRIENSFPNISG